jgi:hypothetical protein
LALVLVGGCGEEGGNGNGNGTGDDGDLVRACIRSTACGVKAYPRCANRATSCQAIEDCYGAVSSCTSSFTARCEDGKAVYCDLIDHVAYTYDCAAAGMTCQIDPQNPWTATCEGPGTPDGTISTAVRCDGGVCHKTDEACTVGVMNRCLGEALQACLEGVWVTYDCAKLGLGPCKSEGSGAIAWARCGLIPL